MRLGACEHNVRLHKLTDRLCARLRSRRADACRALHCIRAASSALEMLNMAGTLPQSMTALTTLTDLCVFFSSALRCRQMLQHVRAY